MTMHHTDPDVNWLSTTEAAQRMHVSVTTVRVYARRGELQVAPRDPGSPYRISPASIDRFLRELRAEKIAREAREGDQP